MPTVKVTVAHGNSLAQMEIDENASVNDLALQIVRAKIASDHECKDVASLYKGKVDMMKSRGPRTLTSYGLKNGQVLIFNCTTTSPRPVAIVAPLTSSPAASSTNSHPEPHAPPPPQIAAPYPVEGPLGTPGALPPERPPTRRAARPRAVPAEPPALHPTNDQLDRPRVPPPPPVASEEPGEGHIVEQQNNNLAFYMRQLRRPSSAALRSNAAGPVDRRTVKKRSADGFECMERVRLLRELGLSPRVVYNVIIRAAAGDAVAARLIDEPSGLRWTAYRLQEQRAKRSLTSLEYQ